MFKTNEKQPHKSSDVNSLSLSRIQQLALLALSAIISITLIHYGADGVRGTDQYWYIADVERILSSGHLVTNNYFPGDILRNGAVADRNYIMHNSPMLYLVALFAQPDSVYKAWIHLNVVFHLIVAFCIYKTAIVFTNKDYASLTTSFYLISPIAIWQSINPLLEMFFSVLVAGALFCFYYRNNTAIRIILSGILLIGVITHPIFVLPALAWALINIKTAIDSRLYIKLIVPISYFIALLILNHYKDTLLPSSFQPNLRAIIASVSPGVTNMLWHYTEILPTIDSQLLIRKFFAAINRHFFQIEFAPLYIFTNISLIAFLLLLIRKFKRSYRLLLPTGILLSQYIAILLLQQNHPRYQQIIACATFILIAAMAHHYRSFFIRTARLATGVLVALWIGCIAVDLKMAKFARQEAQFESNQLAALESELAAIPQNAKLASIDLMPHNPISYIVRPRDVLFLRTDFLNKAKIIQAIELFSPDYIVARNATAPIPTELVKRFSIEPYGTLELLRVINIK